VPKTDLLRGTLDLLILEILTLGLDHGWGTSNRISQSSRDGLHASQGSLYPALHRLELRGDVIFRAQGGRATRHFCRVRAARRAAALRAAGERRFAALLAWRDSACFDAALRPSPFNARVTARDRLAEGRLRVPVAARLAERALCFVLAFALAGGGGSLTPARRAFDSPIAIACLVDRAPCLPSRMCSISSCTNSPACVEGAFPARLSLRARSMVFCSGIVSPLARCPTQVPRPDRADSTSADPRHYLDVRRMAFKRASA
jgi:PadR family transcriptional regulator